MNRLSKEGCSQPLHVQRTKRRTGNVVRLKTEEATTEYAEVTISFKGEELSFIPFEAFLELLKAYKDGRPILDYEMIFLNNLTL